MMCVRVFTTQIVSKSNSEEAEKRAEQKRNFLFFNGFSFINFFFSLFRSFVCLFVCHIIRSFVRSFIHNERRGDFIIPLVVCRLILLMLFACDAERQL